MFAAYGMKYPSRYLPVDQDISSFPVTFTNPFTTSTTEKLHHQVDRIPKYFQRYAEQRDGTRAVRSGSLSPVRGTSKKNQKRERAEGVEGPSPGGVWGGNGRALMGPKGPYLLSGEILIPGLNRPVQSRAVNWATAGLLAGPLACWRAIPAAPRRQQPQAT